MSTTITQVKEHLAAQLHGSTLNKVRNFEALCERAANNLLLRVDPVDAIRVQALSQTVHDQLTNYALASDFAKLIDIYPQANRTSEDKVFRRGSRAFDIRKSLRNKDASIESIGNSKFLKLNYPISPSPKTLHNMDSLTANGTWSAVGSATGLKANSIYKYSGSASVEFDLVVTGDGVQNTTMSAVDLTDEDEIADVLVPVYIETTTNFTSASIVFGNDLTTNYWTSVAQTTQADGTSVRSGWNIFKFPWATATETGTVAPATIDSFKFTIAAAGAISDIRVDNIMFSVGEPFDLKYYSKFLFRNTAGTWLARPTSDDDVVVLDSDALNLFLNELLILAAQQLEAEESSFDMEFAKNELYAPKEGLYSLYRKNYPSQVLKELGSSTSGPRWPNYRR